MTYGQLDKYDYRMTDGTGNTCLTCKSSYVSSYGDAQCVKAQGSIISECGTCVSYEEDV